jgi:hydroxymethylglutaryl-CoA synthase
MAGIISYGAYIPPTRLSMAAIAGRPDKPGGPEKAVAWNDEDSVTMAVAAGLNCLRGVDRSTIDAVFFASTTSAFEEKQAAALIAKALDVPRNVRTADYGGSLRAGTNALLAAADAVAAGSAKRVLVIASDCRLAPPRSELEASFGDGAVAFLLGNDDAIATLAASHAHADEIVDVWRNKGERFVRAWEQRFVVQEGFLPNVTEAVQGLLGKTQTKLGDYSRVVLYAPDQRTHAEVVRALKLAAGQAQDPLFGRLGNAGAAFALLQLAFALESAQAGERLLVVSYGDGAEALAFSVTDRVKAVEPRRGVTWHLGRRRAVASYDRYLKARNLNPGQEEASGDQGLSATIHFRERDDELSFHGQQCKKCKAVQFPAQRICETCFAKDAFDSVRLSDRKGKVLTYTLDFFFPTPDPPTIVTVTDIDGARVHIQLVNIKADDVKIDMPVEFTFRRIHEVGGRPNYYWKGTPVAQD